MTDLRKQFKWPSAHEWLFEHIKTMDLAECRECFQHFLSQLDGEAIEDFFSEEMGVDGYYEDGFTKLKNEVKEISEDNGHHLGEWEKYNEESEVCECTKCEFKVVATHQGQKYGLLLEAECE